MREIDAEEGVREAREIVSERNAAENGEGAVWWEGGVGEGEVDYLGEEG